MLEEYVCQNPRIGRTAKAKILQRFTSVQSVLREPDLLRQTLHRKKLFEQVWRELLDLRLDHPFEDEPPRFLGCANIAAAHWCHFKSIFSSIKNEYGFKGAYDEDIQYQGEKPTVQDYNKWLSERLLKIKESKKEVFLERIKTPDGAVFWDWDTGRIVVEEGNPDPMARGELVESRYAEEYPSIRFHFEFMDKIILGAPDGVTDEFCYEFKSTKNDFLSRFILPVARAQANLYAYFLKRPRIRVQIHILDTGELKTIEENANYSQTEAELAYFVNLLSRKQKPISPKPWKCRACEFANKCKALR